MIKLIVQKFFSRLGVVFYFKKDFLVKTNGELKKIFKIEDYDIAKIKGKINGGLRKHLLNNDKLRWLDIGCGGNFEDGFYYVDVFPENLVSQKDKYFRADIVNLTSFDFEKMEKFDFIRMQHVFEHFTPEDGLLVLGNCSRLLRPGGYILISTPDLKKFVHLYTSGKIRDEFKWARERVDENSPDSFYFSVFTHSVLYEKHHWCYDAEGLIYQLEKTNKFINIEEITLGHDWANVPFTHNRPNIDVCILAQVK